MDVVTPKCLRNGHLVAQQSIGKKQRAGLAGQAGATPGWPSPSKCCRCRRRRGLAHLPERILELLQGLGRQARSDVLSKRLAEWQRKELEQLLLRQRDVSQLPKSGPPVAAALKQVTLPKKVSQGVQRLARKPPLVPRKRARATRREQAVKATEHGIFCRHARGGTKYRACISFSNLRLQARPRSSLLEAQHDLTCLASIRQRVAAGSGLFEHRVRTAMAEIEAGPRSGITFQVACAIFRHVLLSPVFEAGDFDSALAAWRRVRAALQRPEETCMGRPPGRSPAQSRELWLRLRRVYQELWLEAGATAGRVSKSLERIEELAEAHLQREWESWNRAKMAAEERAQRRVLRREQQENQRMAKEDREASAFCRRMQKGAAQEATILRRLDKLLAKWSPTARAWTRSCGGRRLSASSLKALSKEAPKRQRPC